MYLERCWKEQVFWLRRMYGDSSSSQPAFYYVDENLLIGISGSGSLLSFPDGLCHHLVNRRANAPTASGLLALVYPCVLDPKMANMLCTLMQDHKQRASWKENEQHFRTSFGTMGCKNRGHRYGQVSASVFKTKSSKPWRT